jgi:nucleoside-diphosphate-sugar epimerase
MTQTRVLVTGGAGYIGSVLMQVLLQKGHRVICVDKLIYGDHNLLHLAGHPAFTFVRGDARDERLMMELLPSADVIVPLAALVGVGACAADTTMARQVNLDAVRFLNAQRSKSQLLVYPNTNSGYGRISGEIYCTEDTPLEPISHYGVTKVEAEQDILGRDNTVSLRLATVFGLSSRLRLDLLVNHFVHAAVRDGYLVIYEKDAKRNYVHIEDVADCFSFCIDHPDRVVGHAFNLGLDQANLSKQELAIKVKSFVPSFFMHFAEIGYDPDRRNYIVSNEKLASRGFVASRTLDQGIAQLIKGLSTLPRASHHNC